MGRRKKHRPRFRHRLCSTYAVDMVDVEADEDEFTSVEMTDGAGITTEYNWWKHGRTCSPLVRTNAHQFLLNERLRTVTIVVIITNID